jgi:flagellar biogenesis protein FliO
MLACLIGMLWGVAAMAAPPQNGSAPAEQPAISEKPPSPEVNAHPARADSAAEPAAHHAAPAPAHSPLDSELIRRGNDGGSSGTAISPGSQSLGLPRVAGALAIVLSLIFLLRWGGKKLFVSAGHGKSTRAVQILARSSISPKQHILLLRIGRRVIVVGDSGAQMNPLSEITDPDEIASLLGQLQDEKSTLPAKAFSALFSRARDEFEEDEPRSVEQRGGEAEDDEEDPQEMAPAAAVDPAISETRQEISGLMDRIRVLSKHFPTGPA